MVRLKFLLFALLVIGLGLAHLPMLSGPLRARAVEGATAQSASGIAEVARRVDARRAEIQALALKLAATPEVASAVHALVPAKPAAAARPSSRDKDREEDAGASLLPLTAERFAAVRTAVEAVVPKELKGAVVAVAAPDASFHAVSGAEPSSDATKLDVAALVTAGSTVVEALGTTHVFASVPVLWGGDFGMKPAVTLVLGAPLFDEGALEAAVQATGVTALGLVKGDSITAVGPEKLLAEGSLTQVVANSNGVVLRRGALQGLGPVSLPMLTEGDAMGGQAPLSVGSRRSLQGTSLDVLAVAGTQSVLGALAAYQQSALMALAGLLVLTLVWTALMGGGARASGGEESLQGSDTLSLSAAMAAAAPMAPQPPPVHQPVAAAPTPGPLPDPFASLPVPPAPQADPFAQAAPAPLADPFSMAAPAPAAHPFGADPFASAPVPPAPLADPFALPPPVPSPAPQANPFGSGDPFASADAFPFPAPPPAAPPANAYAAAATPFGAAPSMPFEPEPASFSASGESMSPASPRRGAFAFEDQPTAAYSLQQAANPFALAAAQSPENPETTRVAAIPRELLQASARPPEAPIPLPARAPSPAAIPLPGAGPSGNSAVALSEEQHFQEVFREFVTTRERCGEAADGLTYDKFVQKLRKNKEQLVQKYACKTVRFQVYVKEGKAALKATPVKD
ncbi:MXAN_5187 family protein [Myxococcus stipitatus]|uniref:MXAN_5187 family protein n=1 Tax=Myxococcus stipitatus TaxID=83455 RepID=UPI0030D01F2D